MQSGYIERHLKPCNVSQAPGDLCLTGDNYSIVLNGVSSRLVLVSGTTYRLQNDPYWKVEKFTNGAIGHPDTQKEYWLVTTPDGTKYRFGGEFLPTTEGGTDQNSAWFVPVYSSGSCTGVSSYWVCDKAWRWNLDRVEDTNGNVVAYFYNQELNYYNARTFIRSDYVRAGQLSRIEYGRRKDNSTTIPTRVNFVTENRCEGACAWPANYPDTPGDLECASSGTCTQNAPTFWSKLRLNYVEPQYYNQSSSAWVSVARYDLDYTFPTPPKDAQGDSSEKKLWLNTITQKLGDGTGGLPAISYGNTMLVNRWDHGIAGVSPLYMPRLNSLTTQLGGVVTITYGQSHACQTASSYIRLPYDCFPAWFVNGSSSGWTLWNKWKVTQQSSSDSFAGNDTQILTYSYSTPTWHYSDDPALPDINSCTLCPTRHWNDFRGSEIVTVTDSSGAKTEYRFQRGMNGDRNTTAGGSFSASITLSDATTRTDDNWLRGQTVESRRLTSTNSAKSRSVNWFTATLNASSGINGAYFVAQQKNENTLYGTVNKTTRTEYTYDSYGNVTREVRHGDTATTADDRNVERSFVANTSGWIINKPQWEKLWSGTSSGTAGAERALKEFFYDGATSVGTAPTLGNLTKTRDYSKMTTPVDYSDATTTYDGYGRPTSVTDARNYTTRTAYDSFYGYTSVITNTLNHVNRYVVDPGWGVQTKIADPNSKITEVQYDGYGRLQKVWLPTESKTTDPASLEFVYDAAARPANVKSRTLRVKGSSTYLDSWAYVDGFGRALETQTPLANGNRAVAVKKYNSLGQVIYTSTPFEQSGAAGSTFVQISNWTTIANYQQLAYDELGRTTKTETRSAGALLWFSETQYDGWVQKAFDPNNQQVKQELDAFGQLVKVTEYNVGGVTYNTLYGYDYLGNLTSITDHLGNVSSMSYDLLGRKTAMSDPDMGAWSYSYDKNGNLLEQTDARGWKIAMTYDALNRLTGKYQTSTAGPVLALYEYDTLYLGQLAASKAYNGTDAVQVEVRTLAQDNRYRPTQQRWTVAGTGGGTFRMDYAYNEADQRTSLTYPGDNAGAQGETVSYSYNSVGQLTGASGSGVAYISTATYNAQGQLTQMINNTSPNGLTRQWSYATNTLRLATIQAGKNAAFDDRQKLTYGYDNIGNITSLVDTINSGQKQCFQYDYLNRLTAAFTGNSTCTAFSAVGVGAYNLSYGYDAIGNMTTKDSTPVTYVDANHKHAANSGFGNTYTYDQNGNQTTRNLSGTVYTLTYDYENRLTAISGGASATFVYDADGNRVKSTVGGVTTVYIAGLYEFIENGTTDKVTKYYEGNALRRSGYGVDDGVFYLLQDHLKSSSVFVNQSGTTIAINYYLPYGGNRGGTPFSTLTTKRFTGQYHENGLTQSEGLSYYGARWYDAKLGRFLSADSLVPQPADPQSLNRYSYVYNKPLQYIDPTGHCGVTSDNVSMEAELGCNDGGGIGIGGRSSNISSGGGWFSGLTKWFSRWRSSSSTSAESPWIQMNPYSAQRTLPVSNDVNNARHLTPIELASPAKPVTIVAQNAQPLIRADLPQAIISGHGQYDSLLPAIRQPGTTLVYYTGPGGQITNELGNLIELGKVPADVVRFVYPPGTNAPNLSLSQLPQNWIQGSPIQPPANTNVLLSDFIGPNMGVVHIATCLHCSSAPWAGYTFTSKGVVYQNEQMPVVILR